MCPYHYPNMTFWKYEKKLKCLSVLEFNVFAEHELLLSEASRSAQACAVWVLKLYFFPFRLSSGHEAARDVFIKRKTKATCSRNNFIFLILMPKWNFYLLYLPFRITDVWTKSAAKIRKYNCEFPRLKGRIGTSQDFNQFYLSYSLETRNFSYLG